MKTTILTKLLVIPMTMVAACGSMPVTTTQPVGESSEVQNPPVIENTVPQTEPPIGDDAVSMEAEAVSFLQTGITYPIVDTDQGYCYDDRSSISCPSEGDAFYGQDAQYSGNAPRYQDNVDGTVTDLVTGLMWSADPGEKMTYDQAVAGASSFNLAGYNDWRLPSIKELYSLIQFDGLDPSGPSPSNLIPFIDTSTFNFEYGNENAGERLIDSQWATSSVYSGSVMGGGQAMFGVNFADGRIKGYPTGSGRGPSKTYFVIYVRGNTSYGINNFGDNGNGTVTDHASGLTWTQNDSGEGMNWEAALIYCESLDYAGSTDWRTPNAKELQSIVDYNRSPDATNSAAIDPVFNISTITNEAGQLDYPAFWSSTTHANARGGGGAYVNFGRSMGYMNGSWKDVHGAGAQRSDPKTGSASDWPTGHGPQGDAIRVNNYVRCVTAGTNGDVQIGGAVDNTPVFPDPGPDSGDQSQLPPGQTPNSQGPPGGGGRPQIDFAVAAAQLGVSEESLRQALGPPPPDFAAAAAQLGVTETELIEALGIPPGGPPNGGGSPPPPPDQS